MISLDVVGLGPGDPELITMRGYNKLKEADIIFYPKTSLNFALNILKKLDIDLNKTEAMEFPIGSSELKKLCMDYALRIQKVANSGKKTVYAVEGDPMFYSTFIDIMPFIDIEYKIIPGISSVNGMSASLRFPLATKHEDLIVIPAVNDYNYMKNKIMNSSSAVIIKPLIAKDIIKDILNLDEITSTIKDYYSEGLDITRLHSGDPSIYGAINDEIQFFNDNGMEYEIVPGISSVFAAVAKMGIELTSPGTTQTVILTRVPRRTEHFENEDLSVLAAHKTSIAIFLSASNTKNVTEKLLKAGFSPDDRAIIAYRVTWPDEKIIETTVKELEHSVFENKINRQALILVGGNISSYSKKKSYLYNPEFTHLLRKSLKED